jgi:hypothetical protein
MPLSYLRFGYADNPYELQAPTGRRAARPMSTSPPRSGTTTSMLRRARSGCGRTGRMVRFTVARSTSRISISANGDPVTGDLDRLPQQARRNRHCRARPQHLLDDRIQIRRVAIGQAGVHRRSAGEPLERPRQRCRRAVMTAHQQRHQLVPQVLVGRGPAVLVTLGQQQRQHRVAVVVAARVALVAGLIIRLLRGGVPAD